MSTDSEPAKSLSGVTLAFLFSGAFILLAGPLIWRQEGRRITGKGREATLHVGFGFLLLSLASVLLDLGITVAWVCALAVVVYIALLEILDARTEIRYQAQLRYEE